MSLDDKFLFGPLGIGSAGSITLACGFADGVNRANGITDNSSYTLAFFGIGEVIGLISGVEWGFGKPGNSEDFVRDSRVDSYGNTGVKLEERSHSIGVGKGALVGIAIPAIWYGIGYGLGYAIHKL